MAFPVVEATNESAETGAVTTHDVSLPAGIEPGDLLLVLLAGGSVALPFNALTGWSELVDENVAYGCHVWYRMADGTEGATVTFTSTGSSRSAHIAYRISGAAVPGTQAPQISTVATGTSAAPDPTTVTPTGGAKDYLWVTFFANGSGEEADDDTWCNNAATNYSGLLQKTGGTGGTNVNAILAASSRTNNAASEDAVWPASTTDVSRTWRAFTIAVHPGLAATDTSVGEISLADAGTPSEQTNHTIKVRARKSSAVGIVTLSAALYEGTTNRSGDLTTPALTTSLADYSLTISDANAANITDYSDLGVRFWANSITGDTVNVEIAELSLELPASAGPPTNALAGTITAIAAVSGAVTVARPLAGTVVAAGATAGALTAKAALAGTAASSSSVSGALTVKGSLVGAVVAATTVSGNLNVPLPVAGVVAASSSVSGSLTVKAPLAGAVASSSTLSGSLTVEAATIALAGTIAASTAATGALTVTTPLVGASTAQSQVTGTLSNVPPGAVALAGVVSASSTVTGTLTTRAGLAGVVAGTATVAGVVSIGSPLAGVVAGSTTVAGALTSRAALAGVVVAASSMTGDLTVSLGPTISLVPDTLTFDWQLV